MSKSLKTGALLGVLLGIAALVLWQQYQIKRLAVENTALHTQLNQLASLRDRARFCLANAKHGLPDGLRLCI
jgi:hypothetical protein